MPKGGVPLRCDGKGTQRPPSPDTMFYRAFGTELVSSLETDNMIIFFMLSDGRWRGGEDGREGVTPLTKRGDGEKSCAKCLKIGKRPFPGRSAPGRPSGRWTDSTDSGAGGMSAVPLKRAFSPCGVIAPPMMPSCPMCMTPFFMGPNRSNL